MTRSVWGRWPMVVSCWFVGAGLVVLWLLSVWVVAAGAASPDSPSGLSAVLDDDVVVVSWTAPAGGAVTYQVYRRVAVEGDEYKQIATTGSTVFRDRISGLSPGFEYYYRVKAVDSQGRVGGWGPGSNYAALTTPAPGDLKATLTADDDVVVTWTAPAGIVKEYEVYRRAAVKGDKYIRIAGAYYTSYWNNAELLRSGFEYYYRVKAVDSQGHVGGWGSGSNYAALTVPAPRVLSAGYSAGSVEVTWTVPFGGAITYEVYRRAAVKGSVYKRIGTTRATVYTDHVSGLTPGVEYYYRVKAVDDHEYLGGWGSSSNYGAAIYTPPPSGLSAVVSAGSVVVSWTAPLGHPAGYEVYRRAAVEGDEYQQIGTTSGSTVYRDGVSGLSPGVEYYYRVKAVDRRGSSGSWGTGSNYADVKMSRSR